MIDDLSVVQTFVRRKNEGKRVQSGAGPGRMGKSVVRGLAHGGAFANGDFEGRHGRKTFEDLAHSQPGYEQEGQEQDDATSQNVPASSAPQDHEQGEDPDFGGKAEHAAAGSGEGKGANGQQRENGRGKPALAAHFAEDQGNQSDGNDQFGESREVIAIDVRSERNTAVAHFAKPEEFAVEGEVLKNSEDGHEKPEGHHKPHETAPIFGGAKGLAGEKQKDGVGEQELQFEPSVIRRSGALKNNLPEPE